MCELSHFYTVNEIGHSWSASSTKCGKTHCLNEFWRRHYVNVAYFSFENNERLAKVFDGNVDPVWNGLEARGLPRRRETLKNIGKPMCQNH